MEKQDSIALSLQLNSVDTAAMTITTGRIELLSRLLDVAAMRQDVIAQNVANVNTPGFQTLDVSFEQALQERLMTDPSAAALEIQPEIVAGTGGIERADGNNVDIDLEMGRLQKNGMLFRIYAQIIANELAQHRSAITGR